VDAADAGQTKANTAAVVASKQQLAAAQKEAAKANKQLQDMADQVSPTPSHSSCLRPQWT